MSSFDEMLKALPLETRGQFEGLWGSLTAAERESLGSLFKGVPSERKLIGLLLELASTQVKHAFGTKHRVAIVGPANVGKSTLFNQFIRSGEDPAEVSPVPGTTRVSRAADTGLFVLVDTPGADAAGTPGEAEREQAFEAARGADFLVILFDSIQGIKAAEQKLFADLTAMGKPYVVALNKSDLVKADLSQVVQRAAENLRLEPEQIIPISARHGHNLDRVLLAIAVAEPQLVASLGQAMPAYRWRLAWRTIISSASISAVIALMPLPMIDFIPLVTVQALMVFSIARIYNQPITVSRAKELIAAFGLGFLGRTVFQELSKFGGVPGWLLASAIACSTTVAMGYAASVWFERGERVSSTALKQITENLTKSMLASLGRLGKRRPDRETLEQSVIQALDSSPYAADRTILDRFGAAGVAGPAGGEAPITPDLQSS